MTFKFISVLLAILISSETSIAQKARQSDSVATKEGNYYKFLFLDSNNYKIKWGNKNRSFISQTTFQFGSWGLLFTESSKSAILLTQSCGTSCRLGVLLLSNGLSKEYMLLRAYDLKNNLVAYVPSKSNEFIRIENFLNGKPITIKGLDVCPAAYKGDCIDSCSFSGKTFYIKWQGSKWKRDVPDCHEKTINVESLTDTIQFPPEQRIVYDLPDPVIKKIDDYLAKRQDTTKVVSVLLDKLPDGNYLISILEKDDSGSEGSKLINDLLIKQTSRFIRVENTYVPLITGDDLLFADLGTSIIPKGNTGKMRTGKTKVMMTHDGFSIKFDSRGKIY